MTDAVPLLSVLVRSMDRPTLARSLASIAAQDVDALEVVVVGAVGASHRSLPDRCGRHPLRLVASTQRLARADAANVALDAARGAWLNFLDDDDEWLPQHVRTLRAAAAADPGARLVHARSEDVAADGRVIGLFGAPFKPWRQLDSGVFHPCSAMFARSLCTDGARFDPRFEILEDMDFFVQCAQRTRFAFVPAVTARYHAAAGDSGAGVGGNRDAARVAAAIGLLRAKWAVLEAGLRRMPEFRLEHAQWLAGQGQLAIARELLAGVLAERPGWAEARAFGAGLDAALRVR